MNIYSTPYILLVTILSISAIVLMYRAGRRDEKDPERQRGALPGGGSMVCIFLTFSIIFTVGNGIPAEDNFLLGLNDGVVYSRSDETIKTDDGFIVLVSKVGCEGCSSRLYLTEEKPPKFFVKINSGKYLPIEKEQWTPSESVLESEPIDTSVY